MLFTVALCTHNHAGRLVRTFADLATLQMPQCEWELLVVDNGCTDGTPALLANHTWPTGWDVRVIRETKLGLSNARNCAIREARGEYLIFIDDDETPVPGWLEAYEKLVREHAPDAFGSRIEVLFEGERPAWLGDELLGFLGQLRRSDTTVPLTQPDSSFYGGNFGFRKSVCDVVGMFDAALGRKVPTIREGKRSTSTGDCWPTDSRSGGRRMPPYTIVSRRKSSSATTSTTSTSAKDAWRDANAGSRSRFPPLYLYPQLGRSVSAFAAPTARRGAAGTVRAEMNVSYFVGYILGWAFGSESSGVNAPGHSSGSTAHGPGFE